MAGNAQRHRAAGAGCVCKRRILIGRGEDCDVQWTSDRVSRHHCEVVYKDGHYELNDLGSTNGTYLNGTRVRNESC